MHIQRYLLSLPSSLFITAINPSKPEIVPWTFGPHAPAECPSGQRETLHTALVRRSARVRHIRVVTVYITWHILWRNQWTLTTGIVVVVTIGVKPAHLEFSDSTMGPVLWEFHYLLIIFSVAEAREFLLVLQLQRQCTVFPIISIFSIISILKWAVTKFKAVQIYCSRECNELC